MPRPPDLSLYVPVLCLEESKYKGNYFMEPISRIKELNGQPVSKDRKLTKADFASGDKVVVRFNNKDFRGIVDFSRDEETLAERVDSPLVSAPSVSEPLAEPECTSVPVPVPATTRARVRKRHRSQDVVGSNQQSALTKLQRRSKTVSKLPGSGPARKKQRTSGSILAGSPYGITPFPFGCGPSTVTTHKVSSGAHPCGSGSGAGIPTTTTCEEIDPTLAGSDVCSAIERIESKLNVVEARLEIWGLKEEAAALRKESGDSKFETMLDTLMKDVQSLKRRQDMLFAKQDMIQATLAGDAPVSRNYRSLSGSSIVVWSPIPNSPPFVPPTHPPQRVQAPSLTPTSMPPLFQQGQEFQEGQLFQQGQRYSTPRESADELSVFSAEEIESLLSEPWEGQKSANLNRSPAPVTTDLLGFQSAQSGPPAPPPPEKQGSIPPRPSSEPGKITSYRSYFPELGTLLADLGIQVPPPAEGRAPGIPDSTSMQGNDQTEGANQAQSTRSPLSVSASASDEYFSRTFTSTSLIPANVLIERKLKNKPLDVNSVGRFAILLARCCFFGDDVLQISTLKGKGNRRPLDTHKLESLMSTIHEQLPSMSMEEFCATVRPKVERALRDYLKPSGTISKKMC